MMPNRRELHRAGLVALSCFLVIDCSGCLHRAKNAKASPPPVAGATLVVEFVWTANPEDDLGTTRTVILNGRLVSAPRDLSYVSCFGADRRTAGCQDIGEFNTTSVFTPGPVYDGTETINNAQLGHWQVAAAGDSSGGANANQTCSVNVDTNRLVTVKISLGVDAGCSVQ
jgi:hypothetical protein